MTKQMSLYGILKDHNNWAAQIDTTPQFPDMILFTSQNKAIITGKPSRDETKYHLPPNVLQGHSQFVSDVSSDSRFALSGSWDGILCFLDFKIVTTTRQFVSHTKGAASSSDNWQIVSRS